MQAAIAERFDESDVLIMSAAVADARPVSVSDSKIKKENLGAILLEENQDLLKSFSSRKRPNQIVVGFAAETESDRQRLITLAKEKMSRKGADFLYVNDVSEGRVFGADRTSGAIISGREAVIWVDEMSKEELAAKLLDQVRERVNHG